MNKELFNTMIEVIDQSYDLINEYENKTHQFENTMLYPMETSIIKIIGIHPGITVSEISIMLNHTVSACSQILKKIEQKNLIIKEKNKDNNRKYHLYLNDEGKKVFIKHQDMENNMLDRYYQDMINISDDEIETYIKIQKILNNEYIKDLEY